ncbi:hypothetical protein D9M68_701230 [compost metagenome]
MDVSLAQIVALLAVTVNVAGLVCVVVVSLAGWLSGNPFGAEVHAFTWLVPALKVALPNNTVSKLCPGVAPTGTSWLL